jgi:hypothetical protein
LTWYLKSHDLIFPDGTLKEDGMSLFLRLNGALQLSQISHGQNTDLTDALMYFQESGTWPGWILDENYIKFIKGTCPSPRVAKKPQGKIWQIFRKS